MEVNERLQASTFTFTDQDGVAIFVYKWVQDESPKAAVQISYGLGEHAGARSNGGMVQDY